MNDPAAYDRFEQAVKDAPDFDTAALYVTGWLLGRTYQPSHPGFQSTVLKVTADIRGDVK